jgi:hypothetical protein
MAFKNHTCWNPDMLQTVLGADATKTPDHVFKAIHQPVPLFRASATTSDSQEAYDERRFLNDFMAPDKTFMFVPVIGQSGTGKSHLIRWLDANIEKHDKRRVIFIPRLRTNLRGILLMILEGLKDPRFAPYRQRLNEASTNLTSAQLRAHLLNNLAVEVGPEGQHDVTSLTRTEKFYASKDGLVHLLYDPYFREHLLCDDGIMHQLVEHTLGGIGKADVVEKSREFSVDDLPLNVADLAKAGKQAQFVANHLRQRPEEKQVAVDWLNKHLNNAIKRVLNMGREDMATLMREVRESLAEEGVELVLLIEDIFKFQGVEHELLDAVIADPHQTNGKPLCQIRTAMGCTTGYFKDNLMDTLRTRISFIADLDVGEFGAQSSPVTQSHVAQFVARYLNAARHDDRTIVAWANQPEEPMESACQSCEHRAACHAGFGEVDGVGLYPFNARAIEEMTRLVHGKDGKETFRPRLVLSNVIGRVLDYHGGDLRSGNFPPVSLLNHFGIKERNVALQMEIKRLGGAEADIPRRETLLRLWSTDGQLCNLHDSVHDAFALPKISVPQAHPVARPPVASGPKPTNSTSAPNPVSEEKALELQGQIDELNRWVTGDVLGKSLENILRPAVLDAVCSRIDWDAELLLRTSFTGGTGKPFQGRNIQFIAKGKTVHVSSQGVTLNLPLVDTEDERSDTILAFYAIVRHRHYKGWDYPQGFDDYLHYTRMLDRWSQHVLNQVRAPRKSGKAWDPVPAMAELLAVSASLAGRTGGSLPGMVDALFQPGGELRLEGRSPAWTSLVKALHGGVDDRSLHAQLVEVLSSRIPCTKGSSRAFQVIDACQLVGPLQRLKTNWQPQEEIPDDIRPELDALTKAKKKVDEWLGPALAEEHARHLATYQRLVDQIGKPGSPEEKVFLKELMEVANLVHQAGVWGGPNYEVLEDSLKTYKKAAVGAFATAAERLLNLKPSASLPELAFDHGGAIKAINGLIDMAEKFLDASISRADNLTAQLGQDEQASLASVHAIERDLDVLHALTIAVLNSQEVPAC